MTYSLKLNGKDLSVPNSKGICHLSTLHETRQDRHNFTCPSNLVGIGEDLIPNGCSIATLLQLNRITTQRDKYENIVWRMGSLGLHVMLLRDRTLVYCVVTETVCHSCLQFAFNKSCKVMTIVKTPARTSWQAATCQEVLRTFKTAEAEFN